MVCAWCCGLVPICTLTEKSVADQKAAVGDIGCQGCNSGDMSGGGVKQPFSSLACVGVGGGPISASRGTYTLRVPTRTAPGIDNFFVFQNW